MFRQMLRSKIHRATVTDACLEYEGSLTVDETLLEAAGILSYEAVVISNLNNGERFTTYVIPGKRGSGTISTPGGRMLETRTRLMLPMPAASRALSKALSGVEPSALPAVPAALVTGVQPMRSSSPPRDGLCVAALRPREFGSS